MKKLFIAIGFLVSPIAVFAGLDNVNVVNAVKLSTTSNTVSLSTSTTYYVTPVVNGSAVSSSNPQPASASSTTFSAAAYLAAPLSGGTTAYRTFDVDETGVLIKGGPGQFYGISCYNAAASSRTFKFYDKVTAPTVGTDNVAHFYVVPASSAFVFGNSMGVQHSFGIGIGCTTGPANNDTGAPATGDCSGTVYWK